MEDLKHKAKLIGSGLLEYYVHLNANDINVSIKCTGEKLVISSSGKICEKPSDDEIIELNRIINTPRSDDMAMYYAELLDLTNDDESIFHLLGLMIDSGKIDYIDGILKFYLERKY